MEGGKSQRVLRKAGNGQVEKGSEDPLKLLVPGPVVLVSMARVQYERWCWQVRGLSQSLHLPDDLTPHKSHAQPECD